MKVTKTTNERPETADTPVTVKIAGNTLEVRYSRFQYGVPIRKLDKDHGVDLRTGEVIVYRHANNRGESTGNVAQSLRDLRDLINANLTDPKRALWVTLTYRENMQDEKRLYEDFRRFWQRFKYDLQKQGSGPVEYITAAEPQGRGAWHLHCLFLFAGKTPFIPNAQIAKLWGHGYTKTQSLKGVDNPGLYLTAYLGDMEFTEAITSGTRRGRLTEIETIDEHGRKQRKAVIKGARLHLYPAGFNLYRCTRGVKRPKVYETTEGAAQEIIGTAPLTYEKTVAVTDYEGQTLNIINYRQYNRAKAGTADTDTKTEIRRQEPPIATPESNDDPQVAPLKPTNT